MDDLYKELKEKFFIIAGPCVIESEEQVLFIAKALKELCDSLSVPFIFKVSFDKANRTSGDSYRGLGLEQGLNILKKLKETEHILITSDVHERDQVAKYQEVLDIIQIPAFLCRQTDLILEAARSQKIINIKKGQFISPNEIINIIEKVHSVNNHKVIITERGTSFGYNNLVVDMRTLEIMKSLDCITVFDATHSTQIPGGSGTASSGNSEFVYPLARAATAVGVNGLFFEVHNDPKNALCDKDNMVSLDSFKKELQNILNINNTLIKNR